ncbi:hypothetical protein HYH03_004649 [Edaphochlamys debaryana]|uniref:Uncharacterized protein n=1 Tax=Edaphochlamys debaryana TaxID=47281 RepID=A0A835Y9K4_9CHLO|nr:hypothetical protein HYH03_004649 [Edaphochlamys debaryana]|eukprot:KAG2497497.1 hypothetical protein HYH03_004649 [Edaphochlamys debaryana]
MFHSTLRCKSGAAAGASNTLLRAYVHAVGANCDDQEARREAFETAQRLAEAEKELQQASAPAGAAAAALAGAPRPSTSPPIRDGAASSPAAAAASGLEAGCVTACGGAHAQPSSGPAPASPAASRGGGGCASGDVALGGPGSGSGPGPGPGCEALADNGCASSPEIWGRASGSRLGLAVDAAAAVAGSAGAGSVDAGGSGGPHARPLTRQPGADGSGALPPPGSAAAAAQAVEVRPAWDCLAPPPAARYGQGVWTWSQDHHFHSPPGAELSNGARAGPNLAEALSAPSNACWGTAMDLDALTLATALPMNTVAAAAATGAASMGAAATGAASMGAAAAGAASLQQSRVLAAARAASTGPAQFAGELPEGAWVAGAAWEPRGRAQSGSAWPQQELGLEPPQGYGWRGPAGAGGIGGAGRLVRGGSERGGGAQHGDVSAGPDDVMDELNDMTSDASLSAPAALEMSTAAPVPAPGGGGGGFRCRSAGQGLLRGAQLSGGVHLLQSGGWQRGEPEAATGRAPSTGSNGSGVGALLGCGPTGPDGGRPLTPAALAVARLLQSARPQAIGGIAGNDSGGGGGGSGSNGVHGWLSLPTAAGLPGQPAAAEAPVSFNTWGQAGQLPLSDPTDPAMGPPPRLAAVTVTGRASHAAYPHAASVPALDLSIPVSVSPVDPLTLCASTLSAPAFPAGACATAPAGGTTAWTLASGGAAGFSSGSGAHTAGGGTSGYQGFGACGGGPRLQPSERVLNLAPALAPAAAYAQSASHLAAPGLAAAFAAGLQAGASAGVAGPTAAGSARSLPPYGAVPLLELEAAGMGAAAAGAFLSAPEGATNFHPPAFPASQSSPPALLSAAHARTQRPDPAMAPYAPPAQDSWAECQAAWRLAGAALEALPPQTLLPPPLPLQQPPPPADWEPPSLEVLMADWLPSVGATGVEEFV